jgi:pentatricopeptide repeat protein
MHPRVSGQGFLPRYGGGWMHQFGHVYALQQELLASNRCNWFRAVELWHTARHEGLALNSSHYNNILRQCAHAAAWEQSLSVLRQMRRDALRPDVPSVACAMASCADSGRWEEAMSLFREFQPKMKLDSQCYLALMKAANRGSVHHVVIEAGKQQLSDKIPFQPPAVAELTQAADIVDTAEGCRIAIEAAENLEEYAYVRRKEQGVLLAMAARHHLSTPPWLESGEGDLPVLPR